MADANLIKENARLKLKLAALQQDVAAIDAVFHGLMDCVVMGNGFCGKIVGLDESEKPLRVKEIRRLAAMLGPLFADVLGKIKDSPALHRLEQEEVNDDPESN